MEDGTRPHLVSERGPEIHLLSNKILSGLIFDDCVKVEGKRKDIPHVLTSTGMLARMLDRTNDRLTRGARYRAWSR